MVAVLVQEEGSLDHLKTQSVKPYQRSLRRARNVKTETKPGSQTARKPNISAELVTDGRSRVRLSQPVQSTEYCRKVHDLNTCEKVYLLSALPTTVREGRITYMIRGHDAGEKSW